MNFEDHIRNYFQLNDFLKWSVLEVLSHISDNVNFTSENLDDIQDSLEEQLKSLSNHKSIQLAAKIKAIKLLKNLPKTLKRKDVLNFLEKQDLKFAETMYVKDIFEDSIQVSSAIKDVTKIFLGRFSKASIMDLRPGSRFSLFLDLELQTTILHEVFDEIDNYITDDIHEYLTSFFDQDFTAQGWDNAVNNMNFNECDSKCLKNIKKLIQETLPIFLKAFSLGGLNPLRDITILKKPHLDQFVHPIIDSALWNFAKVNYIYGEMPLAGLGTRIRADGVGFLNDVANYPIVCGEGDRPGASQKKGVDDDIKNASSMTMLYNNIVIAEADARRQLFTDLRVYGLTAFKTKLSLTMMDFRSVHRLFEVDNFFLPKKWVDMPNFVWLYEAVIKWALCVNSTRNGLIERRMERRVADTPKLTSQKN